MQGLQILFKQHSIKDGVRHCSAFDLIDNHSHALASIEELLRKHGFDNLEVLGSGSYAVVLAPNDSSEFVIRISKFPPEPRFTMPYMLQAIGSEIIKGDEQDELSTGYVIEYLKRMEFKSVAADDLSTFLREIGALGYGVNSIAGGAEIGKFTYQDSRTGEHCTVLMASDPSSINPRHLPLGRRPCVAGYPTVKEQYLENLRIAQGDKRLGFLVPCIQQQLANSVETPTQLPNAMQVHSPMRC